VVRGFTVHLLVGVLLACPFPCLAKAAGSGPVAVRGHCGGGDCCCPKPGSESDQRGPTGPERCDGGTCLCHGAVMDRLVWLPSLDFQLVAILPADEVSRQHAPAIADARRLDLSACDFAWVCSGRMLRAQIESLLI